MSKFYVEIRPFTEDETDPGFRRMEAQSLHDAKRIARGASINLNGEKYYAKIVVEGEAIDKDELIAVMIKELSACAKAIEAIDPCGLPASPELRTKLLALSDAGAHAKYVMKLATSARRT